MNRTRIYWLCFLGIGVLDLIWAGSDFLAGRPEIATIAVLVGGVGLAAAALYSLTHPEAASGTANRTFSFWAVILGFVLMLAGTILQFV